MMNRPRQTGYSLTIGLLVLLAVVMFGFFALHRVTLQGVDVRIIELDRLLQSEAQALIMQIKESLRRDHDGTMGPFQTISPDVRYTITSRDQGICLAMGSDITQKYKCCSVEITLALSGHGTMSNSTAITRTYTVDFQYPVQPEAISG